MPRILILIILLWILYFVVKRLLSSNKNSGNMQDAEASEPAIKIVACSQCGLHVPENESKIVNDLIVCNNPTCNHASKTND